MIRLNTDRLELVAATVELVQLELNQTGQLAQLITAEVPARWPPELFTHDLLEFVVKRLEKDPALADWLRWYWIKQDKATGERILIGVSCFTTPTSAGIVEIAYSVMEEFRGFGYATEAIKMLISWVFSHIELRDVIAEVLPENIPSIHVLEKTGFRKIGEHLKEGMVLFCFEHSRDMYESRQNRLDLSVVDHVLGKVNSF